ncbi:FliA/WhiG family RNA polymerase sigma factor [Desulfoplanes formicivorans]|uniref:RNA polymerase sigma factor n=1 Tax=Desulfoplanes formicivorans TaxID=1592317 RepID=A0A194AJZ9_9BACT|nr:FliA/WhiG family RNA polymerase sigma factor [Desulfoplanes formicivorans]GAU09049.1 RNA polymerase sigma factor [Desulfoplanes formicivorans]
MNKPWLILEKQGTAFAELDPATQQEMVRACSVMVKAHALRLKAKLPNHIDFEELLSAGSLGLMEALYKYDPASENRFETYADKRIKGAMLDELRKMDWLSRGMRQKIKKLESAMQIWEAKHGAMPSHEQLASITGYPLREVARCMEALENQFCLDIDAIEDTTRFHLSSDPFTQPFNQAAQHEIIDKLGRLIEQLPHKEALVLSLYYTEELNMREIAQVLEVTEGRVSQLHSQAIKKLREKFSTAYGSIA